MANKLVCISSQDISLTAGKAYTAIPDAKAADVGCVRVVDDTEEDYCFPARLFEVGDHTTWEQIFDSSLKPRENTRCAIVLERGFEALAEKLRERNIDVIVSDDPIVPARVRNDVLANRVLIARYEEPYVPCRNFGLICLRYLSWLEPSALRDVLSKALFEFAMWTNPHSRVVYLRDDGEHEHRRLYPNQ